MKQSATKYKESVGEILNKTKWNLFPFYLTIVIYILFNVPMEEQTILGMVIKCLPIVALQYFVWNVGITNSFNKKIFVGLIFSCIGDAFLDFPDYFLHGTIAFAISQILNILAFGFKPLNLALGAKTAGTMGITLIFILPKLLQEPLSLQLTLSCYTPCLITMVWRSIARVGFGQKSFSSVRLLTCIGAISFGISDSVIGLNRYLANVSCAQAIIMTTYYLAQFGIAMSVIEYQESLSSAKVGSGKKGSKK